MELLVRASLATSCLNSLTGTFVEAQWMCRYQIRMGRHGQQQALHHCAAYSCLSGSLRFRTFLFLNPYTRVRATEHVFPSFS